MVGVIGHIANPTVDDAVGLARAAETAGATWVGLADAFWWRDVWMLLAEVAVQTSTIEIGPAMTNPYLRHPFHTASALATLRELAPGRTFAGITAGGSEVTVAASIPRTDAAERVADLVATLRRGLHGEPLDPASGRCLDVPASPDPIPLLIAGRGSKMLGAAGALADRVLLWAIPDSDLDRTVAVVRAGAAGRDDQGPAVIWAPLVRHSPEIEPSLMHVAVYASLNTRAAVRERWGLDPALVDRIRRTLVAGGTAAATALVPAAALEDLVVVDASPPTVAARAAELGVTSLAVPGYSVDSVAEHIDWARDVERHLV